MKTQKIIREALDTLHESDRLFNKGNYEASVESYKKALQLLESLPAEVQFDRAAFEASCQSGLSATYGRLGRHLESFAAANKALLYYDKCGEENPLQTGRWLKALVNQGVSLAALGVCGEALNSLQRAKDLFVCKGLNTFQNKPWLDFYNSSCWLVHQGRTR